MLPELISNIILAGIAIFIMYTIAPLITGKLSKKRKRNVSKEDFDRMVQRKIDLYSQNGSNPLADTKNVSKSTRTELDYFVENKLFESDEDKKDIFELKKELQWGSGPCIDRIKDLYSDSFGLDIDENKLNSTLRSTLKKDSLLKIFAKNKISFSKLASYLCNFEYLKNLSTNESTTLSNMTKKLMVNNQSVHLISKLILNKSSSKESVHSIEDYLAGSLLTLTDNEIIKIIKKDNIISCNTLVKLFKDRIETVIALQTIDLNDIISQFSASEEKEFYKKKYKKLVSRYHPDKWTHFEKTDLIDKRLRENFDIIQKHYETLG